METVTLYVGKLEDSLCYASDGPVPDPPGMNIPLCMAYYIKDDGESTKIYIKENDDTVFIKRMVLRWVNW